jgi:hypothetical protein
MMLMMVRTIDKRCDILALFSQRRCTHMSSKPYSFSLSARGNTTLEARALEFAKKETYVILDALFNCSEGREHDEVPNVFQSLQDSEHKTL